MGSCFGKKPSSLRPEKNHREFTSVIGQNSYAQKQQIDTQRSGPVARSQIQANNSGLQNMVPNSSATSAGFNLKQYHLNADSTVTNTTSVTSSEEPNPTNKFNKNAYVALFDYAARTIEDLSFKKGHYLIDGTIKKSYQKFNVFLLYLR